jgi:site-specific DNA recombinase
MWMGGPVPLGYEVKERKLLINEAEAATVRHIFRRYADLGSGQPLLDELREQGIRTKRRVHKDGSVRGDIPFTRGSLFHLLKNRIYRGEMVHKGSASPGEHEAIIDEDLWARVQLLIAENTVDRKLRRNAKEASLLAGIIRDGLGRKMTPSHTARSGKRYRYYVTHPSAIADENPAWRLPAYDIEKRTVGMLVTFLSDQSMIRLLVGTDDAGSLAAAIARCQGISEQITASTFHRRTKVPALIEQVDVTDTEISIVLSAPNLSEALGTKISPDQLMPISVPIAHVRKGKEVKLVISENAEDERDEALVSLLRDAMAIRKEVLSLPDVTIANIAASSGRCRKRMGRLFRLSWIAPEIVDTILAGRQPQSLSPNALLTADLPLDWQGQKAALGFI